MLQTVLSQIAQCHTLQRAQAGYPARLMAAEDPPETLHVLGNPGILGAPHVVALVGARAASAAGLARARLLAAGLVERGTVVISGGAIGIDAAAHAGTIEAGGRTAAVVAGGVIRPYPSRNHWLFDEMLARDGALVSPFTGETPVRRWSFLRRNAVIAALADAVVVVEAQSRSGSLHTARAAARSGRQVLAVPGSPGTELLIAQGAGVGAGPEDVLAPRSVELPIPEGEAAQVLDVLDPVQPFDVEGVSSLVGLPPRSVARALVALELDGLALPVPGGSYIRSIRACGGRT